MSPWLPKATVAIEDRRFWQHGALDYQGIARALYADIEAGQHRRRAARRSRSSSCATSTSAAAADVRRASSRRRASRRSSRSRLHEAADPRRVPERGLLRAATPTAPQAGAQTFFSTTRDAADAAAGRAARRAAAGADGLRPVPQPDAALARRNEVLRAMLATRRHHAERSTRDAVGVAARAASRARSTARSATRTSSAGRPSSWSRSSASGSSRRAACTCGRRSTRACSTLARARSRSVLRAEERPGARARRDRPARRARPRDGRRTCPTGGRLQFNLATQGHRQAGSVVQAVHARDRARAGHLALHRLQRAAGADDHRSALRGRTASRGTCTTTPTSRAAR